MNKACFTAFFNFGFNKPKFFYFFLLFGCFLYTGTMQKQIWAPWRIDYIRKPKIKKTTCLFCDLVNQGVGEDTLILYQTQLSFIMLNRYPYASGHLMVLPKRHLADFTALTEEELLDTNLLIQKSLKILTSELGAENFNVGLNLGEAAGAGVKDHLHTHIVPRWAGDHNFMPVIGDTSVMPEHLIATYQKLKPHF